MSSTLIYSLIDIFGRPKLLLNIELGLLSLTPKTSKSSNNTYRTANWLLNMDDAKQILTKFCSIHASVYRKWIEQLQQLEHIFQQADGRTDCGVWIAGHRTLPLCARCGCISRSHWLVTKPVNLYKILLTQQQHIGCANQTSK